VLRLRHLFNQHVPRKPKPGLAGNRRSPFWILLRLKTMEVVVTTGALRCAKLQSNHNHQRTITQTFLQAACLLHRPANSVKTLKGKSITFHGPAHLGISNLLDHHDGLLVTLGEGCQASCQPSNARTPC